MAVLHEAVQALGGLLACCNGIYGELRPGENVAAYKDVRLGGLISKFVGYRINAAEELDTGVFEEVFEHNSLADCKNDQISVQRDELRLVVLGSEFVFGVEHGCALLEHDSAHTVLAKHLLGTPAGIDDHAVLAGFRPFFQ